MRAGFDPGKMAALEGRAGDLCPMLSYARSLSCIAALMAAALPAATRAQDEADGVERAALVQEGGLIRDEMAKLIGPATKLDQEGARLDADDRDLRAQSQQLDGDIREHNRAMEELARAADEHRAACPHDSEDRALVESCNARALEIRSASQRLEAERPMLRQRQSELNGRIERYNAERRDWTARKNESEARLSLNRRDLRTYLERVKRYTDTAAFRAAYKKAGGPSACAPDRLHDLDPQTAAETLAGVLGCLHALER